MHVIVRNALEKIVGVSGEEIVGNYTMDILAAAILRRMVKGVGGEQQDIRLVISRPLCHPRSGTTDP
jgi:hypothetical protein